MVAPPAAKPFFFLFTIIFSLTLALSRDLLPPHATKTTILDVSSSLQQALNILSFNPQQQTALSQQQQQTIAIPSFLNSSFSLSLNPRDTIHKTPHKDYKALVLSRLHRDSSRVQAITTRLQLILNGVSKSDLKPLQTEIQPQDLSTPVSSGTSQGSGEYFTRVGVGNPAKSYYMVLDTGSDINWIQCQPCSDCYQQSDPIFTPAASSSYSPLTCDSQQCNSLQMSSCRNGQCRYQVNYGDGSFTFGDFVTETMSFGGSGTVNSIALGCGHDNEGLFVGAAGLLGLGGGPLSLTSQLKATSFSYCLVNRDSAASSTLDFNSAPVGDSVIAPLLKSSKIDTFYYVGLSGMSVGGELLRIPQEVFKLDDSGDGGVIVDCGTAITRLQSEAYNSLRDSFVSMSRHLRSTSGVALFDTCYDLSGQSSVKVPTVSFHFDGGKSWDLPAANYLIPVDSAGTYCFAFAPTTSSLSIIGNVQQQGTRVSFDLANNRVGFSTNKC
ncbi:protein ASPARTIC PROTEASE IN GUARD CELL 1 [Ricinus communis]|uniref:Aspartic proteinase nepenthesin-1, putative n=1 Tax=Ricinus communis TaxID=3988 RepID=B9RE23_RICCO|nr:protein ASPARTIC PROTEASE IN GUARD CELL 1 [Ricinus communis]EEF50631.1 Aspartic proteinase nepenthesin-1 precursor, putative [Ricinus communis]|eukprot:XP_002511962.1 protein ASPARTIC PROTEASE IN GUARD CELL 1 [Ricinus communis]